MKRRREDQRDPMDEAVGRILDQVELVDPPEDLRENVLRAIGTRPEPAREGWLESLRAGFGRRIALRLYPIAAGAAAAVVAYLLLSDGVGRREGMDRSIVGAMLPGSGRSRPAAVDEQRFELGRANVQLEAARSGNRVEVSVSTEGAGPVWVTLRFEPKSARVERLVEVPTSPGGVEYGSGWVRLRQSGSDHARIIFVESGAGDAPIRVGVDSEAGTIQGALRTRGTGL